MSNPNQSYPVLSAEALNRVLSTTSPHSFKFNIARMHDIYRLPKNNEPTLDVGQNAITRLDGFKQTMLDEVAEWDTRDPKNPEKLSIRESLALFERMTRSTHTAEEIEDARQDVLTDIADWLSDMIVYCRSEAMKFGLPLEDVQDAVMGSNFTKVGEVPTYDANGKVQKDLSLFVPPESAIKTLMFHAVQPEDSAAPNDSAQGG